jgi:hypothetical protein
VIDFGSRKLTEGVPTPGSRMSVRIGAIIQARFDAEAPNSQVLQNRVVAPDGRIVNGNLLLRDEAAANSRGVPFALEGLYVTQTGDQADRHALQREAFELLAQLEERRAAGIPPDPDARQAFVQAEYFLYQGPEYERGGDAMIRTLLVTAHARVFGEALRLPQDIDVMAHAMSQQDFTEYAVSASSLVTSGNYPAVAQHAAAVQARRPSPGVARG